MNNLDFTRNVTSQLKSGNGEQNPNPQPDTGAPSLVSPGGNRLHNPPHYEFNTWYYPQIYRGDNEYISALMGGVVPNVNDRIIRDLDGGTYLTFRVTRVDPVTHLSSTEIMTEAMGTLEEKMDERLFAGAGVGLIHGHDYIFINKDTVRFPAEVSRTLRAYGSRTRYYKLFLGTDIDSANSICISVHYDSSGNATSENIPVELIDASNPKRLEFRPAPFNLNRELEENQLVTLVGFTDEGGPVSFQPLRTIDGATIRDMNAYTDFITGIELVTPYIGPANRDTLIIPENFLHTSILTRGKVNYSSGKSVTYNIGENGMQLINWDSDVSGQFAGQERKLVLQYTLGVGETAELIEAGGSPHISKCYTLITAPAIPDQSVKLYACPTWDTVNSRYKLRFWLLNLSRSTCLEVTDKVQLAKPFEPSNYNAKQRLNLSVKMSDVTPSWPARMYAQSMDVFLRGAPTQDRTPFELYYANVGSDSYGESLQVIVDREVPTGQYYLNLTCELTQQSDWLDKLYNRLMPQYNLETEGGVVTPSHVEIITQDGSIKVPVERWNRNVNISFTPPRDGDTIFLRWYKRDQGGNELNLAMGSLMAFSLV